MSDSQVPTAGIPGLRRLLRIAETEDPEFLRIASARDDVFRRYQPEFSPDNLAVLSEETFRGFLMLKNNRHWASLQRLGPAICADMGRLRQALAILLDDSRPLRERLNQLVPVQGPNFVPKLSKAVLTPILLIRHPDRYGVWNQTSEGAMRALGLWPEFDRSLSFGERYERVNEILVQLASELACDLWTLDGLWWRVDDSGESLPTVEGSSEVEAVLPEPPATERQRFGLERHLHEFLRDNWEQTTLGESWKIYEEDGDDSVGYEYPCDVGRIDILARHRREPRWLVIELKRDQSSDRTVGQILRYMGWVQRNLAAKGEPVEGMIIAHKADDTLRYALEVVPSVRLQVYEVEFRLKGSPFQT